MNKVKILIIAIIAIAIGAAGGIYVVNTLRQSASLEGTTKTACNLFPLKDAEMILGEGVKVKEVSSSADNMKPLPESIVSKLKPVKPIENKDLPPPGAISNNPEGGASVTQCNYIDRQHVGVNILWHIAVSKQSKEDFRAASTNGKEIGGYGEKAFWSEMKAPDGRPGRGALTILKAENIVTISGSADSLERAKSVAGIVLERL